MAMSITQVRLPDGLVEEIDNLVERGFYATKSDVVRDAVRKLVLEKHISTLPNKGSSVREIRALRKKLSKEEFDLETINHLITNLVIY